MTFGLFHFSLTCRSDFRGRRRDEVPDMERRTKRIPVMHMRIIIIIIIIITSVNYLLNAVCHLLNFNVFNTVLVPKG